MREMSGGKGDGLIAHHCKASFAIRRRALASVIAGAWPPPHDCWLLSPRPTVQIKLLVQASRAAGVGTTSFLPTCPSHSHSPSPVNGYPQQLCLPRHWLWTETLSLTKCSRGNSSKRRCNDGQGDEARLNTAFVVRR